MNNSIWENEANVEALVALWDTDKSAAQIAAEIGQGLTKNAIISKAIRLGLDARGKRCSDPAALEDRKKRKTETDVRAQRIRRGTINPKATKIVEPVGPVEPLNLTFNEIGRFQCRWIGNDDMTAPMYCGHATIGVSSWCAFHDGVVMPPRREISEQEAQRRREQGAKLGLSQVAARRSGLDLRARNTAAMPVE